MSNKVEYVVNMTSCCQGRNLPFMMKPGQRLPIAVYLFANPLCVSLAILRNTCTERTTGTTTRQIMPRHKRGDQGHSTDKHRDHGRSADKPGDRGRSTKEPEKKRRRHAEAASKPLLSKGPAARDQVGGIAEIVAMIVGMFDPALPDDADILQRFALVNKMWNYAARRSQWAEPTQKMVKKAMQNHNRERAKELFGMVRNFRVNCTEGLCRLDDLFDQPMSQLKSAELFWDPSSHHWEWIAVYDLPNSKNFLKALTILKFRYRGGTKVLCRKFLEWMLVSSSHRSIPTPPFPRTYLLVKSY